MCSERFGLNCQGHGNVSRIGSSNQIQVLLVLVHSPQSGVGAVTEHCSLLSTHAYDPVFNSQNNGKTRSVIMA